MQSKLQREAQEVENDKYTAYKPTLVLLNVDHNCNHPHLFLTVDSELVSVVKVILSFHSECSTKLLLFPDDFGVWSLDFKCQSHSKV